MTGYIWKSSLAPMIGKYLDIKHAAGFKYVQQERCLQHFDHYFYYSGYDAVAFTRESIEPFLYREDEELSTWCMKETLIADLVRFLNDRGYRAYIPAHRHRWKRSVFVPHIYTREERIRFLHAVDAYPAGHGEYSVMRKSLRFQGIRSSFSGIRIRRLKQTAIRRTPNT